MRFVHLALIVSDILDKLREVSGWKVRSGDDHDRQSGRQTDWREILGWMVFEIRILRGRRPVGAHVSYHNGVIIGHGAGYTRCGDGTACTGVVLHHFRLT